MELDDRRRADELDHYWNAMMTGELPTRLTSIDIVTASVVSILSERQTSPRLAAVRQRVRRRFLSPAIVDVVDASMPPSVAALSRNDRFDRCHLFNRQGRKIIRWFPGAIAIAALLILVIGIGYLVAAPIRSDRHRRDTIPAAFDRATPRSLTPTPSSLDETVVDIELPAEVLKTGGAGASLAHFSIPPGTQTTWSVPQNAVLLYLWQGSLSVNSESDMRIQRAAARGTWETIPAGRAVEIGPGDATLLFDLTTASFSNVGTISVEFVIWGISSDPTPSSPAPPEWVDHDYALSGDPGAADVLLQGRAGRLRLSRVVFEAGRTLPAPAIDVFQLVIAVPENGDGTPVVPFLVRQTSGKTENYGQTDLVVFIATFEIAGGAGTPIGATPTS